MVGVRKLMEMWFFSKQELKYLDDLMPEFTLRSREDSQKAREEKVWMPLIVLSDQSNRTKAN